MRDIIKNIQLPIDGALMDFRLTKLDAFSGAALLQLLTKLSGPKEPAGAGHSAACVESGSFRFIPHSLFCFRVSRRFYS